MPRGVEGLSNYLRGEQAAGRANPTVDAEAVALMVIDAAFGRAARRQMLPGPVERLPSADRLLDVIGVLLAVPES
jgi:hypothetical protein